MFIIAILSLCEKKKKNAATTTTPLPEEKYHDRH